MSKKIIVLILIPFISYAGGGGHGEAHVPISMVISQIINTGILFGIIYFFAGKQIAQFFASKKEEYLAFVESASKSVGEAEARKKDLDNKLKELRQNFEKDLEEAKASAEENYRSQIADTKNEALKIESDTEGLVQAEFLKAVEGLRMETYSKSADLAEKNLNSDLTEEQQRAWNEAFPSRLKGVH